MNVLKVHFTLNMEKTFHKYKLEGKILISNTIKSTVGLPKVLMHKATNKCTKILKQIYLRNFFAIVLLKI